MSYEVYGPYLPVIMLITFIALFFWVLSPKNSKRFDDAAQAPFADEEEHAKATGQVKEANNGRDDK
ncbi:cbb3-type cytochrome oxidase subunit 3 [Marinobacterium lutimaris]|uniref:Cbb3-type cytochrome oxidase component FixQ n=1 Tax=Marinobacterium lutimaris TaxID=568106 RepID=A0A1H5UKH2_9GAMM|nr:cbb3-type cytochrome c oxidase subunit 3 [Marinobacterium lutimaris]SEF75514.1 Cbb3-type cytochrome oxidase component FixQ [Marinobacterium lutimaris]